MIEDYELKFHFNKIANKYPCRFSIEDYEPFEDDLARQHFIKLIDGWNDRMEIMQSALHKAEAEAWGYIPENRDDGVSPIVSEPYPITKQLRKKEYLERVSEKYRRKAEYCAMQAEYEGSNV